MSITFPGSEADAAQATLRRRAREERACIIVVDRTREVLEVEIEWCARCSDETPHPTRFLLFTAFAEPIVDGEDMVWTHWALCPVSGDPVLLMQDGQDG